MSPTLRAFIVGTLITALPLRGVYAPIPEQDLGKDFTLSTKAGLAYDSNLFGSAKGEIGTAVWTLAPKAAYNASVTDQTFFSASYGLTLDRFDERPGDKLLDSHEATARVAHAFNKSTTIDISDALMVTRNPESLLAGVKVNTDQSFTRNQLDGRFVTPLGAKVSATAKARSAYTEYRDGALGRGLDRIENIYGVSADYAILPEVKMVGEFRHQDIYYTKEGEKKNKKSDYLMGGVDYEIARKLSLSSRLGVEWRSRAAERSSVSPYAEFTAKFNYTETSFVLGGFGYSMEETSDTARFNDTKVYRGFLSLQHSLTALIVASGSITYEPSSLQGRRGQGNIDERTLRTGVALTYQPNKNWTISGSIDYDRARSDDINRNLNRSRAGLSASYSF